MSDAFKSKSMLKREAAQRDARANAELCVCGHPKDWHFQLKHGCHGGKADNSDITRIACPCHQYTVPLDWPDSEGCYWISGVTQDDDGSTVPAKFLVPCLAQHVLNRIWIVWGEKVYVREDWEELHGPARFSKLREQNPFAPTQ